MDETRLDKCLVGEKKGAVVRLPLMLGLTIQVLYASPYGNLSV